MQQDDLRPHLRQLVMHHGGHRSERYRGGGFGDRWAGMRRPRLKPCGHALAEHEREAQTGAVGGRPVTERDPSQHLVARDHVRVRCGRGQARERAQRRFFSCRRIARSSVRRWTASPKRR